MAVLTAHDLTKVYGSAKGAATTRALSGLSMQVEAGEFVGHGAVRERQDNPAQRAGDHRYPTSGTVEVNGVSPPSFAAISWLCSAVALGFVFQDFNLLNTLSVRENIALPLALTACAPTTSSAGLSWSQSASVSATYWTNGPTRYPAASNSARR